MKMRFNENYRHDVPFYIIAFSDSNVMFDMTTKMSARTAYSAFCYSVVTINITSLRPLHTVFLGARKPLKLDKVKVFRSKFNGHYYPVRDQKHTTRVEHTSGQ